jgi:hypothetical protein
MGRRAHQPQLRDPRHRAAAALKDVAMDAASRSRGLDSAEPHRTTWHDHGTWSGVVDRVIQRMAGRALSVTAAERSTAEQVPDFAIRLCHSIHHASVCCAESLNPRYPQAVCKPVEEPREASVSRETRPRLHAPPPLYPQGRQAFYVAFHVEPERLWISSVDNFAASGRPHSVTSERRTTGDQVEPN